MKIDYLNKLWNGVHLEEEEKEEDEEEMKYLEFHGGRKISGVREMAINNMEWLDREECKRKIKL